MTELPDPAEQRAGAGRPRRRPRALPTVFAAAACFAVAFEFLAFQLGSGNDPALGSKAGTAAPISRKIVITKVIPPKTGTLPAAGSSSSSAVAAAAPVTTGSS